MVHRREGAGTGFVIDRTALKDAAIVILPALIVVVAAFWAASRFISPAPPDHFVMATGPEGGAYHLFAQRYRDIVARDGVTLELRPSAGSVENLSRLTDAAEEVQAALVQAGAGSSTTHPGLVSLGSVYYEPIWIFHRGKPLSVLNELAGKRIAIGPPGSGTRSLALMLLGAVGVRDDRPELLALGGGDAADALLAGRIDAAFIVGSADAPIVQRLAQARGVQLLSLANAEAFARRFPFLSVLRLPRGVLDLAAQVPERDVTLLATTATLVVRDDFHPALAFLLLQAASEVHSPSGLLQRHNEFPAARESEFRLSEQADRYLKGGPPFLRRYLPFWLANLIERMVVLLVPIVAVLVPAFKILPSLWEWRVKARVFRWYGEAKLLEDELVHHPDPAPAPRHRGRSPPPRWLRGSGAWAEG